ncbi:hypothetical protein FNV43_RR00624 [Rhamnella rubrinervis]|uniref:Uncharacterized protein n=1 Tax=Rhamnella rubrinervis TaxID=2594499 RepID=A0A8K0HNY5_9ROSA|nr:hypothetical protein FNV43_RR00624 [Rhamnella rubrinervis]
MNSCLGTLFRMLKMESEELEESENKLYKRALRNFKETMEVGEVKGAGVDLIVAALLAMAGGLIPKWTFSHILTLIVGEHIAQQVVFVREQAIECSIELASKARLVGAVDHSVVDAMKNISKTAPRESAPKSWKVEGSSSKLAMPSRLTTLIIYLFLVYLPTHLSHSRLYPTLEENIKEASSECDELKKENDNSSLLVLLGYNIMRRVVVRKFPSCDMIEIDWLAAEKEIGEAIEKVVEVAGEDKVRAHVYVEDSKDVVEDFQTYPLSTVCLAIILQGNLLVTMLANSLKSLSKLFSLHPAWIRQLMVHVKNAGDSTARFINFQSRLPRGILLSISERIGCSTFTSSPPSLRIPSMRESCWLHMFLRWTTSVRAQWMIYNHLWPNWNGVRVNLPIPIILAGISRLGKA